MQLLDAGQFEAARQYVNRRLVERLDKQRSAFTGLLDTVQITFDNSQSPTDTIMDIRSDDTPAFLYALANALAMRNIYITKAQIECDGNKLHDRFFVRNRDGQKLLDSADQQQLRLTAVLIKQFTHALTWASDPAKALASFDEFLDLIVKDEGKNGKSQALDFVSDKKTFPLLAQLLGASDFLCGGLSQTPARQPPSAAHRISGCTPDQTAGDPPKRARTSGHASQNRRSAKGRLEPV